MPESIPAADRDPGTPDDVNVRLTPREPQWDPTVGIAVDRRGMSGEPRHRLVTIGDSLTHGFQSGAVFNTDVSYPAIIAQELGWFDKFRYPTYNGCGGLPINLELLLRDLEGRFGATLDGWEAPSALFRVRQFMDEVEDYWERGPGSRPLRTVAAINHNLAVYGWDLRDALEKTAKSCREKIETPNDNLLTQLVQNDGDRAALRVYPTTPDTETLTLFQAAQRLGADKDDATDSGIETLVVALGSNNALSAVTDLRVAWSGDGYDDLDTKNAYTVWRPTHFKKELALVAAEVHAISARHVIWCTVPHVTIAPLARGVWTTKIRPGSRYFPYYTRPWITDHDFNPRMQPHITGAQAQAIDSAIDQYNDAIVDVVKNARRKDKKDWYVLDIAGLLDGFAHRRYIEDPGARPAWWRPYPLPPELRALTPVPDSRFLTCDGGARVAGGLFSLDGVHPTTIGYGILAQELINVMRRAGVEFRYADGTPRPDPVTVDFSRLIRRDGLVTRPPAYITSGLDVLGWLDNVSGIWRYVHTRLVG